MVHYPTPLLSPGRLEELTFPKRFYPTISFLAFSPSAAQKSHARNIINGLSNLLPKHRRPGSWLYNNNKKMYL